MAKNDPPEPTYEDRADAHDELYTLIEDAIASVNQAARRLRRQAPRTAPGLAREFSWKGDELSRMFEAARDKLWDARSICAEQAYTHRRDAEKKKAELPHDPD